jgi:hypothetical protein
MILHSNHLSQSLLILFSMDQLTSPIDLCFDVREAKQIQSSIVDRWWDL